MNENNILKRLKNLPAHAKKEVLDFIDFLSLKKRPRLGEALDSLREEFIKAGYTKEDVGKALKTAKTR